MKNIADIQIFNEAKLKSFIEQMLVPHTAFQKASKALDEAFKAAPHIKDPYGLFISGESRTGKSRVIEEMNLTYPPSRDEFGLKMPIVTVTVPAKPTVKGLASELLRAFGDPVPDSGTVQNMTARLLIFIKQCHVRIIILDEGQHFVDKSSNYNLIYTASDWLKELLNKSRVVIVIAGLDYAQTIFSQNEQLRGRFANKIILPRFDWQNNQSRNEFLGLMAGFNKLMSEHFTLPDLGSMEMALRFYLASGGLTGYVFSIIRKTAWHVIDDNRVNINLEDLDYGYQSMISDEDQHLISPFSRDFDINNGQAYKKAKEIGLRTNTHIKSRTFNQARA